MKTDWRSCLADVQQLKTSVLVSLKIRDLALVEHVEWLPGEGFSSVTGETGAGKSALIGALNLALGDRADKSLIRHGADTASVEAVFLVKNTQLKEEVFSLLDESGIEPCSEDNELIIKRNVTSSGAGRQWINGSATTLAVLRLVGEKLVDFHGPHDHQSLLLPATQRAFVDAYADADKQSVIVAETWRAWQDAEKFFNDLQKELSSREANLELLKDQVNQIEKANLRVGEDEEISARLAVASQSTRLAEICRGLTLDLDDAPDSIQSRLASVQKLVRELSNIDKSDAAADILSGAESLQVALGETVKAVAEYAERIDADPDVLASLSERYNLIQLLKKKHGPSVQDVLDFYQSGLLTISRHENKEFEIQEAQKKVLAAKELYERESTKLSALRAKAAPLLGKAINRELRELNFLQAVFEVTFVACQPGPHGKEQVEFLFAPNPGEGVRPLRAIASSGEMARVMLAIKTCLAAQDATPLLVFDEVDANIGGETAVQVGEKLRLLGNEHQVLCITHLPQVAAAAGTHFVVEKLVSNGRTKTLLRKLNEGERVDELVRMLGGSQDATSLARSMLSKNISPSEKKSSKAPQKKLLRSGKKE